MLNSLIGIADCEKVQTEVIRNPGIIEHLQAEKKNLEEKLEKVNTALTALQKYPEMVEVFQAISKIRF